MKQALFRYKFFLVIVCVLALVGCRKPNVFEQYKSSVVMIYNECLFKLTINDEIIYFTYEEETNKFPVWTKDLAEARKKPMASFGTGFFCDADGKIATNKHVVYDWFSHTEHNVKQSLRDWMKGRSVYFGQLRDSAINESSAWEGIYLNTSNDIGERNQAYSEMNMWKQKLNEDNESEKYWDELLSALSEAKFDVETIYLGYAENGSYIDRGANFKECKIIQVSDNDDVDLAIIQSLDKKNPTGVTDYVHINTIDDSYKLKVGDQVYMISYNRGPDISNSKQGLEVQGNEGHISLGSNGNRVMYSIPTLEGSSGSLVFNEDGELVAINYAGFRNTQGFNYGILASHLKKLFAKIQ